MFPEGFWCFTFPPGTEASGRWIPNLQIFKFDFWDVSTTPTLFSNEVLSWHSDVIKVDNACVWALQTMWRLTKLYWTEPLPSCPTCPSFLPGWCQERPWEGRSVTCCGALTKSMSCILEKCKLTGTLRCVGKETHPVSLIHLLNGFEEEKLWQSPGRSWWSTFSVHWWRNHHPFWLQWWWWRTHHFPPLAHSLQDRKPVH